jgi:hypothetical protein
MLGRLSSSFQAACLSRLSEEQNSLMQAGVKLPTPQMLPALLALLHWQMTGHSLLYTPCFAFVRCAWCGSPHVAHVRKTTWPWLWSCPTPASAMCGTFPRYFIPSLLEEAGSFIAALLFTHRVHMMVDGSMQNMRPYWGCSRDGPERYDIAGEYARDAWWDGCGEDEVNPGPRQELARTGSVVRGLLTRPVILGIPGVLRPAVFGESVLLVRLSGHGRWRSSAIMSEVLGNRALLGTVLALGQGAQRMQRKAWLQLEVCVGGVEYQPHDMELLDIVVSMLPLCEELVLDGLEGVDHVLYNPPDPGEEEGRLFKSLAFTGLDWAAFEGFNELCRV